MKTLFVMCLLAATTLSMSARAEAQMPMPSLTPASSAEGKLLASEDPSVAGQSPSAANVGLRVASEILIGGLGAIGGGFGGLLIGAMGGGTPGAVVGLLAGLTVGSTLGVTLGGSFVEGKGNPLIALLGAVAGMALTFVIPAPSAESALPLMVVIPVLGAVTGYELSQAVAGHPLARARVFPTVSLARNGRGATAGFVGTF